MSDSEFSQTEHKVVGSAALKDNLDGTISVTFQKTELATEFICKNNEHIRRPSQSC